ncbi:MAG: LuxR C-terminal-related transcriptional regulator, partial [Vulcanimicrobiaceae bacterium]
IAGAVKQLLAERNPDAARLGTTLGNELFVWSTETGSRLVIVVDDVHLALAEQAPRAFFGAFVRALPPRVHLILGSRSLPDFAPIGKLRIGHQLFEITEDDLRFRADEAEGLVPNGALAAEIVERTEGWPIAVHFTASLAQERGASVAQALPKASAAIFAFLAQEVFALMDRTARLQLSLLALPPTLTGELVDFLFERSGGEEALHDLAQRGLYLQRDSDGTWRMHDLFRAFLLSQLKRSYQHEEREMRRRLALWYRDRGDKLAALEQIIESGELVEVVEYVHETLATIILTDKYKRLLTSLATLPESIKRQKPMLSRFYAIALQRADRISEVDAQLAICFRDAVAINDDATACIALIERGINTGHFRYRAQTDHSKAIAYFRQALEIGERPVLESRLGYRKLARLMLGFALALSGEFDEAFVHLNVAEVLERGESVHTELVFIEIGHVHGMLGNWQQALAYGELAEEYFRKDAPYHVGYAFMLQAQARVALKDGIPQTRILCEKAIEALSASFEENELGNAWLLYANVMLAERHIDLPGVEHAVAEATKTLLPGDIVARAEAELLSVSLSLETKRSVGAHAALLRARRLLTMCGDRRLLAHSLHLEARIEQLDGNDHDAYLRFVGARDGFLAISDKHNAAIAWFELVAIGIRVGQPNESEITGLCDFLSVHSDSKAIEHVLPAAGQLLLWSLRNGTPSKMAETFLSVAAGEVIEDIRALACDAQSPAASRVSALRLLVADKSQDVRPLLASLQSDSDQTVAASSHLLLDMLPQSTLSPLHIDVLGPLRIRSGHDVLLEGDPQFGRKKAVELLRLLILAGGPMQKSAVMSALWPDAQSGSDVTLRVTIHALRRALDIFGNRGDEIIAFDGVTIGAQRSAFSSIDAEIAVDGVRLGKAFAASGDRESAIEMLERSVDSFLRAPKESAVQTWMQPHLVRWRSLALESLLLLSQTYRLEQRISEASFALRRALELDPLHEPAVTALLELCIETHDISRGRDSFTAYRKHLSESLGTVPGSGVVERYSQLLALATQTARHTLSAREIEVLTHVAAGKSSKQIASLLALSEATINNHVGRILKKLSLESRTAAVAYALSHGIILHERISQ